jgi:hypothetical protein
LSVGRVHIHVLGRGYCCLHCHMHGASIELLLERTSMTTGAGDADITCTVTIVVTTRRFRIIAPRMTLLDSTPCGCLLPFTVAIVVVVFDAVAIVVVCHDGTVLVQCRCRYCIVHGKIVKNDNPQISIS